MPSNVLDLNPNSHIEPAIECENLETRPVASLKRPILQGINCTIHRGEFVALLGLNGAGKSTLLRTLIGLVPLQQGVLRINGVVANPRLSGRATAMRRDVGMLFQGGGLIRQLSAIDNVLCGRLGAFPTWQTLWGFPKQDRRLAFDLLANFGLKDQAYQKTGQLSGGQQQRVAIARALIQSPQILLADEPITGLDIRAARQVMDILSKLHQERGMTIVVVLHDIAIAAAYAERAIILDQGRVVYDGNSHNLQEQFSRLTEAVPVN